MKIRTIDKEVNTKQATIEMESGDRISIGVRNGGTYHIINVTVQGSVAVVEHEQTGDALVIRPGASGDFGRTQYVKG